MVYPSTAAVTRKDCGAKLLDRENLVAELAGRNYSAKKIGKIIGGNMMRVFRKVLRSVENYGRRLTLRIL